MLEEILRILKEQYEITDLTGESVIAEEIDVDSLTLTSLLFDIEDHANIEIDQEEFEELETINDLVELISQKQSQ